MMRRLVPPLFAVLVSGCDDGQSAKRQAPAVAATTVPAATQSGAGGESGAWPAPLEAGASLAANLLAKNYYLVFDASGSMAETTCTAGEPKLAVAKRAVAAFSERLPADANVGLATFDNRGVRELIPLAANAQREVGKSLAALHAGGGTPLLDAAGLAHRKLREQGARQLGYGEYNLVIVTDGEYQPAHQDPRREVLAILDTSPIVVHTIGFCIGEQHSLNQPGRTIYKAADNPEQLKEGLQAVLAESERFDVAAFK